MPQLSDRLCVIVSIRQSKILNCVLVVLLLWMCWKYIGLYGQIKTAVFVDYQLERCRDDVRDSAKPDTVLGDLEWSLTYYDGMTNVLNRSMLGYLVKADRDHTAAEVIRYLRSNTTNDYGDDPYRWVQHH